MLQIDRENGMAAKTTLTLLMVVALAGRHALILSVRLTSCLFAQKPQGYVPPYVLHCLSLTDLTICRLRPETSTLARRLCTYNVHASSGFARVM